MNRYTTRPDLLKMMQKYDEGTATAAETAFINRYYAFFDQHHKQDLQLDPATQESMQQEMEAWLANYINQPKPVSKRSKLWPRIGIAAAVAGIVIGIYFFTAPRNNTPTLSSRVSRDLNDIAPGGNRATLTAANGNIINLSEAKTGVVVGDDIKYTDGTSVLSSRANAKDLDPSGVGMTTVRTPRGGTYSIILQDGTKIWLNADSKLEFYSNYRSKLQRIVKLLAGEAYLEVAKDAKRPFIVESNGQRIEVLGTHFNVSAYTGEGIKTTLLEGSVRVSPTLSSRANAKDLKIDPSEVGMTKGRDGIVLKPGQQAINNGTTIKVEAIDTEEAIAWKNGYFMFKNEPLVSVMRKLARWYNVEVVYEGDFSNEALAGTISRFKNISGVLEVFELTGNTRFKIEGKKVIVTTNKKP